MTGTVCVAAACAIPGTVAARLTALPAAPQGVISIEHPSGMIAIDLDVELDRQPPVIRRAALIRTARRIFDGHVYVPEHIWPGAHSTEKTGTGARVAADVA